MLSGEPNNTNFIVFGLTRLGLETTIYLTRGERGNNNAIDAVLFSWRCRCGFQAAIYRWLSEDVRCHNDWVIVLHFFQGLLVDNLEICSQSMNLKLSVISKSLLFECIDLETLEDGDWLVGLFFDCLMVFSATFNNTSDKSWWSFLLVEETEDTEKTIDLSQVTDKLYHIMLYTSPWLRFELKTSVVICTDSIGTCKSNYCTITVTTTPDWLVG